uniref:Uncharacterized protein n=1 Tax=Romanomermis culicivorax TaxID=13658 RepID=A0A915J232_ROMCU
MYGAFDIQLRIWYCNVNHLFPTVHVCIEIHKQMQDEDTFMTKVEILAREWLLLTNKRARSILNYTTLVGQAEQAIY